MSLYISLPNGARYVEEETRQLWQVPHFFERKGFTVPRPDPEVYRLDPNDLTLLTFEWQWFWFNTIRAYVGNNKTLSECVQAWRSLTGGDKVITNGRGTDTCADYIVNENLDRPLPAYYNLVFGGTCLAGVETVARGGVRSLLVDTLDGIREPPTNETPISHPWHFQYGVNTTTIKLTKKPISYQINRFSQLSPFGSLFLVLSSVPVTYPLELLKKLRLGAPIPSPYNP